MSVFLAAANDQNPRDVAPQVVPEKREMVKPSETQEVRMMSTGVEHKLMKQLEELTEQMKKMNSRVGDMEKELQELKKSDRPYYGGRNRNWGRGNQSQKEESSQKSDGKPSQEKTLNSSAPPSKGQKEERRQ